MEEKRSEETSANQPKSGRLEEDAESAEQETPPQPPEPLPPQPSLAAKPLALLSPPEEVGGDEHEGVFVCENMVVEVGGVMACDGEKGNMESMQMDKGKELLRQQLHQQQPQLPGAAAPTPYPLPQAPQSSQQSVEAQQLPRLSPPREVGGDENEGVILCKNMVVEIGGVMACDGEKRMMESMQMDKEKELLRQQPHQQQPQLPGAAAPTPWPLPQAPQSSQQSVEAQQLPLLSPPQKVGGDEHEGAMVSENMVVEIRGVVVACDGGKGMIEMDKEQELLQQQPNQQQPQLAGAADPDPWPSPMAAGLVDESNSDWEIASHDFLVLVLGGRATAGSFALGKCATKGGQSDREQDGSNWKREGIGTGWSFSIYGGWGHETPGRPLTRPPRRTRAREKR